MFSYARKSGPTNAVNALKLTGTRHVKSNFAQRRNFVSTDDNNDLKILCTIAHLMSMSLLGKNTAIFFVFLRTTSRTRHASVERTIARFPTRHDFVTTTFRSPRRVDPTLDATTTARAPRRRGYHRRRRRIEVFIFVLVLTSPT